VIRRPPHNSANGMSFIEPERRNIFESKVSNNA
jgi:hypothetical protein